MKKFTVYWEIDVEADDVLEAAKLARDSFLEDLNPSFVVMDHATDEDFFVEPESDPVFNSSNYKKNKNLLN